MPISPPRTGCISRSESPRISRPSNSTLPVMVTLASRTRPSMEYIATLLPEPDSPTMPTTSLRPTSSERPSNAWPLPWRVEKDTRRSLTRSTASDRDVGSLGKAHPRIEKGVEDVDDGVGEHDEECAVHHAGHDDRKVEALQRNVGEISHARQPEDHLGQQ